MNSLSIDSEFFLKGIYSMTYKHFLPYKKQVSKLSDYYKLTINDFDKAEKLLIVISYYDLVNAYKDYFMEIDSDDQNELEECDETKIRFKSFCDFDLLYKFHFYDKSIPSIFIKYSIIVESLFKTRLAHSISEHISDHHDTYLNPINYKDDTLTKDGDLLRKLRNTLESTTDNPTCFYREKSKIDNRNIPAWILFKNEMFSNVINLSRLLNGPTEDNFYEKNNKRTY